MAARRKAKRDDGVRSGAQPRPVGTVEMIDCRRPKCAHHHVAHWLYYTDEERKRWNAQCKRWAMRHPEVFDDDSEDDIDLDELAGGADDIREGV